MGFGGESVLGSKKMKQLDLIPLWPHAAHGQSTPFRPFQITSASTSGHLNLE